MSFDDTFIQQHSLSEFVPKSLPSLLSAARSEFHHTKDHGGTFMSEITAVFSHIGKEAYGTGFLWSDYNQGQWDKFVDSPASSAEGGACMFSCEPDGKYRFLPNNAVKGIGVGVPTGMFAYSIWPCSNKNTALFQAAVASLGKYSLDLVCDHEEC